MNAFIAHIMKDIYFYYKSLLQLNEKKETITISTNKTEKVQTITKNSIS